MSLPRGVDLMHRRPTKQERVAAHAGQSEAAKAALDAIATEDAAGQIAAQVIVTTAEIASAITAEDIPTQIDTKITAAARVYVNALSSSSAYTLTGTATKCPLTSGTLSAGAYAASFDLYDSGSGNADSLRYQDNDGLGTIEVDVTISFNAKHNADDGRPLEFRALSYLNDALNNGGHLYVTTPPSNGGIATIERTTRMTLTDGDYINYRVAYINSLAGIGGFFSVMGAYTDAGNVNITSTAATVPFDTAEESDSNLTLNGDGSLSIAVAGTYQVNYTVPVNDDGSTGDVRAALFAHAEYDENDDGAGYVDIPHSFSQDYARETSGGEGVACGFTFIAAASSRIRILIEQSANVDLSTETGLSGLSLFRIPEVSKGSQSGRVDPYGYQIVLRQAE
jgi:hypothetical protein